MMSQPISNRPNQRFSFAAAASLLLLPAMVFFPGPALGQDSESAQHATHHPGSQAAADPEPAPPMADCQAMMAQRKSMMEEQTAMNEELDRLLDSAREASGAAKVEALEAVLVELISQRRSMHSMMTAHHSKMMAHMMEHMSQGGMAAMCPMMKGMMKESESMPPASEHSVHHPG